MQYASIEDDLLMKSPKLLHKLLIVTFLSHGKLTLLILLFSSSKTPSE